MGEGGPDSGPDPMGGWTRFRPCTGPQAGDIAMRSWGVESGPRRDRAPLGAEGTGAFPKGPPGQIPGFGLREYVGYTGLCAMGPGPRYLILLRLMLGIGPERPLKGPRYPPAPRPAVAAADAAGCTRQLVGRMPGKPGCGHASASSGCRIGEAAAAPVSRPWDAKMVAPLIVPLLWLRSSVSVLCHFTWQLYRQRLHLSLPSVGKRRARTCDRKGVSWQPDCEAKSKPWTS